jgi:hypothetical protein
LSCRCISLLKINKLELSADARRTFRFHLAYALLDAACGGILLNAPFVALREIHGENWQLPMRDGCVGVGMLASLYLGSWMAPRRKMPFVFLPGLMAGLCSLAMVAALFADSAFWFLLFFGVGGVFEIVTRPAVAAILRCNYPVAHRGHITATVREWSSLSFAASIMFSAYILWLAGNRAVMVAGIQIVCAAAIGLTAFLCFRQIRVREDRGTTHGDVGLEVRKNIRDAIEVVVRDHRYRRHLFGCLMEGFFGLLSLSLIAALLSKTLKFGYLGCAAMTHGFPSLVAFAATGLLGRWFDRGNPWVSWAWVRFAFGVDALLLAATPLAATLLAPAVIVLLVLGRVLRGSVQGGWWILWWQIGITHFAPPGEDTSRYAAIMVFLYGLVRIAASAAAIGLASWSVRPETLLWIGGLGVILSGFYSLWQAARERREHRPQTFAEFEKAFADRG